jgi:outer membrane protein
VEIPIMRRTILLTLATLLVAAGGLRAQAATPRIGFINSQQVLENDPSFRQAQEQFDQELTSVRAEIRQREMELDSLIQQYEQQQLTLSTQIRDQRQQEIVSKRGEYQTRVNELQQQADERQQEIVRPVMERINRVIEEIRTEGNYAVIFDLASGAILAADQSLDLTQELVRRLQTPTGEGAGGS